MGNRNKKKSKKAIIKKGGSKRNKKSKKTIHLKDYDDIQQTLLKREEELQRNKQRTRIPRNWGLR